MIFRVVAEHAEKLTDGLSSLMNGSGRPMDGSCAILRVGTVTSLFQPLADGDPPFNRVYRPLIAFRSCCVNTFGTVARQEHS
jgi:hypothetical protein